MCDFTDLENKTTPTDIDVIRYHSLHSEHFYGHPSPTLIIAANTVVCVCLYFDFVVDVF